MKFNLMYILANQSLLLETLETEFLSPSSTVNCLLISSKSPVLPKRKNRCSWTVAFFIFIQTKMNVLFTLPSTASSDEYITIISDWKKTEKMMTQREHKPQPPPYFTCQKVTIGLLTCTPLLLLGFIILSQVFPVLTTFDYLAYYGFRIWVRAD